MFEKISRRLMPGASTRKGLRGTNQPRRQAPSLNSSNDPMHVCVFPYFLRSETIAKNCGRAEALLHLGRTPRTFCSRCTAAIDHWLRVTLRLVALDATLSNMLVARCRNHVRKLHSGGHPRWGGGHKSWLIPDLSRT